MAVLGQNEFLKRSKNGGVQIFVLVKFIKI
jgi:hypothetical protein